MPEKKTLPSRYCRFCKSLLRRKVFSGRLEDFGVFRRRQYCDRICMARGMVKPEVSKSAHHWRARKHRRDRCERCGSAEKLHVHHRDEDWQNDHPSNFETVCEDCHGKEHGPKRGDLFASRQWIDKGLLGDVWAACRDAMAHLHALQDQSATELARRLEDVLHRGGQL